MERGWKTARLPEIPGSYEIPVPGKPELTLEEEWEATKEGDPAAIGRWEIFEQRWPWSRDAQ